MTQEEINNIVVDVIYDDNEIHHVLESNLIGIRGVPINQFIIRDRIKSIKSYLSHLDISKITSFEENKLIIK